MKPISLLSRLVDLIAPRQCPVCRQRLLITEDTLCGRCNLHLPRTGFFLSPQDNEMARLLWGRIPVERCAALFRFERQSQTARAVYDLKYHDHPELGEALGSIAAREALRYDFFAGIDLLVPIPLTRRRQRQRGYNQCELIVRGISRETGIKACTTAVRRTTFHESQTQKSWWERQENVEGVFHLHTAKPVTGKHLLLVDDVMTTGATVTACARELLKAGDVRISVLTLGFVKG